MEFTPDGTKEEIIKALTGWSAESQGTREGDVPATDWQWPELFPYFRVQGEKKQCPQGLLHVGDTENPRLP